MAWDLAKHGIGISLLASVYYPTIANGIGNREMIYRRANGREKYARELMIQLLVSKQIDRSEALFEGFEFKYSHRKK